MGRKRKIPMCKNKNRVNMLKHKKIIDKNNEIIKKLRSSLE